jgi:hypothetical protein
MELHMKKTFSYLAITSCFILGTTLAHADTDASHGKMDGKMQEKMFKAMDTNSDGMVTMDEFNAFHAKKFKELDVNGNGQITLEEMKAGHKKMDEAKDKKMDDSKMDSDSSKAPPPSNTAKPKSDTKAAGDSSNSCCWTPRSSDAN